MFLVLSTSHILKNVNKITYQNLPDVLNYTCELLNEIGLDADIENVVLQFCKEVGLIRTSCEINYFSESQYIMFWELGVVVKNLMEELKNKLGVYETPNIVISNILFKSLIGNDVLVFIEIGNTTK